MHSFIIPKPKHLNLIIKLPLGDNYQRSVIAKSATLGVQEFIKTAKQVSL